MKLGLLFLTISPLVMLLSGCDVIVEAAQYKPNDYPERFSADEVAHEKSQSVSGYGAYYSRSGSAYQQVFYEAERELVSPESITYDQLIMMGIEYSIQKQTPPNSSTITQRGRVDGIPRHSRDHCDSS